MIGWKEERKHLKGRKLEIKYTHMCVRKRILQNIDYFCLSEFLFIFGKRLCISIYVNNLESVFIFFNLESIFLNEYIRFKPF